MDMKAFSDENVVRCTAPNGFNHPLDSWTLSDWMVATMGELGEAANVLKKLNRVRDGIPGNSETPEQLKAMFADELADTYIYLDLLARAAGLECPWTGASTEYVDDTRTLSEHMLVTGSALGRVGSLISFQQTDGPLANYALRQVCECLEIVAVTAGIDFPAAIRSKFDRTSAKIGYTQPLNLPQAAATLTRQAFDKWYPQYEELYGTLGSPDTIFPAFEAGWDAAHTDAGFGDAVAPAGCTQRTKAWGCD